MLTQLRRGDGSGPPPAATWVCSADQGEAAYSAGDTAALEAAFCRRGLGMVTVRGGAAAVFLATMAERDLATRAVRAVRRIQ